MTRAERFKVASMFLILAAFICLFPMMVEQGTIGGLWSVLSLCFAVVSGLLLIGGLVLETREKRPWKSGWSEKPIRKSDARRRR